MKVFLGGEDNLKEFEVESLRFDRNSHFLKLKGIDTLEGADALSGMDVSVPEEEMIPLEDGNYYHFQLIGSTVVSLEGETIGSVKSLIPVGTGTLLAVDCGGEEVLIPFAKPICVEVDAAKKEIRVDLPDGLLDLNEI